MANCTYPFPSSLASCSGRTQNCTVHKSEIYCDYPQSLKAEDGVQAPKHVLPGQEAGGDGNRSDMGEVELKTLDSALKQIGENRWWLFWLFVVSSSPGVFNAMHVIVYVFLSTSPAHWCDVPVLRQMNWTNDQIRNISSPYGLSKNDSCSMFNWDYNVLKEMDYNSAFNYTLGYPKPEIVPCEIYAYDDKNSKGSIDSEWDLVCGKASLRSAAQASIAIGKFAGALFFGFFADKFGRKWAFILAVILYIVAGPMASITYSYSFFIFLRFIIGAAGSGVYESAYTILSEVTVDPIRTRLGCIFNISYPVGYMILPALALYFDDWRSLQLIISLPALLLLVNCWFIPESPRWLLTQGRRDEALTLVKNKIEGKQLKLVEDNFNHLPSDAKKVNESGHHWNKKLQAALARLFIFLSESELRNRIFICYFAWFAASLSYYAIALNADNFTANRYLYVALNGLVEFPGYIVPLLILKYLGRKIASASLFIIAGVALLSILIIPEGYSELVLGVALIGRFCMCAVFAIIILYTSELFPTTIRNTAIGTSLTMAQFGCIAAPFVVDLLGSHAWYIPSTICGITSVSAGMMIMLLPETKDKPLLDSIEEIKDTDGSGRVSLANCCLFR